MTQTEQPGIFRHDFRHFHVLEFTLRNEVLRGALVAALRTALVPDNEFLSVVVAFGPAALAHLDESAPVFPAFSAIHGRDGFVMPATQHDVLFWVQGRDSDVVFDAVDRIATAFALMADLALDLPCFTYHDSRDLSGFVDGTANPKGNAARAAALVPEGEAGAGGSFLLTQRWNHDLATFRALPVELQEKIVGRTKADSVELAKDVMPRDSHVARTDFKRDGVGMKIWRRSMPFGTARSHGLMFLSFSCRLERFDILLKRMAGDWEDGVRDRLTDYSTPVTGSYWYAPPAAQLAHWLG